MVKKKRVNWKKKKYQTKNGYRVISLQELPKKPNDRLYLYPLNGIVILNRKPSKIKRMSWTILGENNIDEEWNLILLDEDKLEENNNNTIICIPTHNRKRKRKEKHGKEKLLKRKRKIHNTQ